MFHLSLVLLSPLLLLYLFLLMTAPEFLLWQESLYSGVLGVAGVTAIAGVPTVVYKPSATGVSTGSGTPAVVGIPLLIQLSLFAAVGPAVGVFLPLLFLPWIPRLCPCCCCLPYCY
jgi:hypothetical protein